MKSLENRFLLIITVLSIFVGVFYSLTASIHLAGGASHFLDWALALVGETEINKDDVAQRDIGFSLIVLLSGFTITKSFTGIIVIHLLFSIAMPIIIYLTIDKFNKLIAFISSLVCIFTLSPYVLIKFVYHDQTYIFFMILSAYCLIEYLRRDDSYIYLFFFTITILMASYSRSAGNYIYPILLLSAFIFKPNKTKYFIISILIFITGFSFYMAHRNAIFGSGGNRAGVGLQSFYATYIPLGSSEKKLGLSAEMGPNTAKLIEGLSDYIGDDVRNSRFYRDLSSTPPDFLENYILNKTPTELKAAILSEPCEEYMWYLYGVFPNNDAIYRNVAFEIIKKYPLVYLKHILINYYSMLFSPGLHFGRYDLSGKRHSAGVDFLPAQGTNGSGGPGQQDARPYGEKLVNEINFRPLDTFPLFVKDIFTASEKYYIRNYRKWVRISNILIVFYIYFFFHYYFFLKKIKYHEELNLLWQSSFVISIYLLYEITLSALLAGPHMRYFHFTELYRIVLCGYTLQFIFVYQRIYSILPRLRLFFKR